MYIQRIDKNIVYHWKHGIPSDDYKQLNKLVVDIFIFRKLDEWLISMYHNNYHLEKKIIYKFFN